MFGGSSSFYSFSRYTPTAPVIFIACSTFTSLSPSFDPLVVSITLDIRRFGGDTTTYPGATESMLVDWEIKKLAVVDVFTFDTDRHVVLTRRKREREREKEKKFTGRSSSVDSADSINEPGRFNRYSISEPSLHGLRLHGCTPASQVERIASFPFSC